MIQKRIAQLKEVLLRARLQVVLSSAVFLLFFLAHNSVVQAQTSTYLVQNTTQITTILADCRQVTTFGAVYENGHVNITWQDVNAMEYTVEYKKKGSSKWYTGTITQTGLCPVYNLQFGKEYEYRIGTRCVSNDAFQYSARYGQATTIIVPIIFTAGEYAVAKSANWTVRLKQFLGPNADDVAKRLKVAEDAGHTVAYESERIVIKNGEETVATITKNGERAEIVEVAGTGTYLENLTRFKQLFKEDKVTELFAELKKTMAFPKMGKTRVRNVTDLETEYRVRYNIKAEDPIPNYPYSRNNPVTDFELEETGYFVRVYDDKPTSYWIFRIEDLRAYKNMDEVAENLALPNKPTKIGLVEIPEGTVLRKSVAGPQPWGTKPQGGGIQYEIIETPKVEWFKPLFKNDIEVEQFFK